MSPINPTRRTFLATAALMPVALSAEAPAVLPTPSREPPEPAALLIAEIEVDGRPVSAITRVWDDARDVARCRLCPRGQCVAFENVCTVLFEGRTPLGYDQAARFRPHGEGLDAEGGAR